MERNISKKIVPFDDLRHLAEGLRGQQKKIVTTNGCFDLLHYGHLRYLQEARNLGDVLIVGLNSDQSVRGLDKGAGRPLFGEEVRAFQLASLEFVDYVSIFEQPTPVEFLDAIRPFLHVKGGDYRVEDLPEASIVAEHGGQTRVLALQPGYSTTEIVKRIRTSC